VNRLITILVCLAIIAVITAVRIEVLNARAGGILPRVVPKEGNPKWRIVASPENFLTKGYEIDFRATNNLAHDAGIPEEISRTIAARVAAEVPHYRLEAELRSLVGSWGVLQYPLCGILVFGGIICAVTANDVKHRVTSLALVVIGFIGLGLAIYRAYAPSLGW